MFNIRSSIDKLYRDLPELPLNKHIKKAIGGTPGAIAVGGVALGALLGSQMHYSSWISGALEGGLAAGGTLLFAGITLDKPLTGLAILAAKYTIEHLTGSHLYSHIIRHVSLVTLGVFAVLSQGKRLGYIS